MLQEQGSTRDLSLTVSRVSKPLMKWNTEMKYRYSAGSDNQAQTIKGKKEHSLTSVKYPLRHSQIVITGREALLQRNNSAR